MKTRTTHAPKQLLLLSALIFFQTASFLAQAPQERASATIAGLPDAPGRDSSSSLQSSSSAADQSQHPLGTASISGTVLDSTGALLPGAKVILTRKAGGQPWVLTSDSGGEFSFIDLPSGTYKVTISSTDMGVFVSPDLELTDGQRSEVPQILLPLGSTRADVEVIVSMKEQAQDQVRVEEKQRAFGIFPNFYVSYDPHFVPLTARLKFELAYKASTDPVTIAAAIFIAGIDQAAATPSYVQGARGFGQRVGATYANGLTDIMFGGAILPSLLHQDPRYFYQGTGTKKSRAIHAMESPFIAKGDNGQPQFNYSSIGGDLISSSLSNLYYPPYDRGPGLVFGNALIGTGGRMLNALAQEFLIHKHSKN